MKKLLVILAIALVLTGIALSASARPINVGGTCSFFAPINVGGTGTQLGPINVGGTCLLLSPINVGGT